MAPDRTVTGDLSLRSGRNQDDSSSSRESSPGPAFGKRKRLSSPGSDDGSPEPVEPFVNDETPQPEDRPLIRQAVGFGGVSSFSLPQSSIYTATVQPKTTGKAIFLPGQVVKKPRRKKKDDAPYKKQASRFRLESYNGAPSESFTGPVIQQGPGPYASAFRGYTDPVSTRSDSPAVTATSTLASHSERSDSPAPTRVNRASSNKRNTNGPTSKTTSQNRSRRSQTPTLTRPSSHIPPHSRGGASPPPIMDIFNGMAPEPLVSSSSSTANYYRLDYDTGRSLQPASTAVSTAPPHPMDFPMMPPAEAAQHMHGIVQGSSSMPGSYVNPPSPNLLPPTPHNQSRPHNGSDSSGGKYSHPSGRIVTILAQDIRSGTADDLLIEVKVPIRPADDPADGYWADAKDLVEQWQSGPARIDGPARVYSLRGKYRQILLRVTSSNEDCYSSANVVVRRDRVIEVIVENLPEAGVPPPRRQIPPDLRQDVDMSPIPHYPPVSNMPTPSRPAQQTPAMARNGASSYSHRTPQQTPPRARSSPRSPPPQVAILPATTTNVEEPSAHSSAAKPTISAQSSTDALAATTPEDASTPTAGPSLPDLHPEYRPENIAAVRKTNKGYDSPGPDDEPAKVNAAITKLLGILIPKEDRQKFSEFFRKASLETASNMVFRYRYVQDLIEKYAGQPAPFRSSSDYIVSESHIIESLNIEDPDGQYASNCRETLHLLRLYGENGQRCENPDVLKLMAEKEVPYNAKPVKRLLRLLRDVDARWTEQHRLS